MDQQTLKLYRALHICLSSLIFLSLDDGPEIVTNGKHLVTFRYSVGIYYTKYINQREILDKRPGVAGSPLHNIISHDPVLSVPQLHRMNNDNLRVIQDEQASTDSLNMWIIIGVALGVILCGCVTMWQILKRRKTSREVQKVIDSYKIIEDGRRTDGK